MADQILGTLAVKVVADWSDLQDQLSEAIGAAQDAGSHIASAFTDSTGSLQALSDAVSGAGEQLSLFDDQAQRVESSAESASTQVENLGSAASEAGSEAA